MLDASELSSVVGYTAIAAAFVDGDVDGECGELIKLDNGMIFEMIITPAQAKERLNRHLSEPVFLYKLVIGEELVDASRVR